jgi:hypothetical protein
MKHDKHIQSFNEHQENLNISDVSDSDFLKNIKSVKGHWFADTFKQDIFEKLERDGLKDDTLFKLVNGIDSETAIEIHNILFKK